MQLRKANKKQVKMKLLVGAPSGAGKTASSLLIAAGMTDGDWDKICVIDSENNSSELYANNPKLGTGEFFHLGISDFSPKEYIKAITACEEGGIEVCIIDSITHCWEWCTKKANSMPGNTWQNWGIVKAQFDEFKNKMLQSPMHIICTVRKKETTAMEVNDKGKTEIVKKGLSEVMVDGMNYEFTTVFDVDTYHLCSTSKDRTNIFEGEESFIVTKETGKKILEWCNDGKIVDSEEELREAINKVNDALDRDALTLIWKSKSALQKNADFLAAVQNKGKEFETKTI